jgi:cytochrome c oxidase cbb3-type subunit 3
MKFINYLTSITGVSIYPMISMLLFTTVFAIALWWAFGTSKATINEQKNLPLD